MYKLLSLGTSFNYGLGLHLYKRKELGAPLDFNNLTEEERYFNYKHSFSSILGQKLKLPNELVSSAGASTFFDGLDILKHSMEPMYLNDNPNFDYKFFKPKVIVIQLTNVHRDFFIYNNTIHKLDFESYEGLIHSKEKLIKSIDALDRDVFIFNLENELNLFLEDEVSWRKKQSGFFIDRINELDNSLKKHNVILKIISYSQDYKENLHKFNDDLFVKIEHNGIEFSNIFDFVLINKLRIKDDIDVNDDHPNFEAHKIVAESLYKSISKHTLDWII